MSSTRRTRRRQRMATSSSPADVDAAVVVVAADAVVAVAVDAVAVDAVAALVAAAAAAAACPGVHAGFAKRDHLPRLIHANNHGRVRPRRPGLFMCPYGAVSRGLGFADVSRP